ncbi:hypothetical protein FGG08_006359 [Glutinoglossum americanum]|uniref:Uncharacterized protein n=1 Tax=Glutinoglossum americanum TaxID=1670608 RepID=A0A9P8L200_9PEZI|nr:hypothetical protein FGG08_006359 [Glutinoglossum americanum]
MSFGFSVNDFIMLIALAQKTYRGCRHAPVEFDEAGRAAKGLYTILESIETDIQNAQSPLRQDKRRVEEFDMITSNCKMTLLRLDAVISRYRSLGTTNKRLWDRFKLPVKDLQDIKSGLTHHISVLSVFLDTVGLETMGRVEGKVDDGFEGMLRVINRLGAEIRAGKEGTVMTDYTNDETDIWKQFRRELIGAGYKSGEIQRHKESIKKYLRNMSEQGLLDEAPPERGDSEEQGIESEGSWTRLQTKRPTLSRDAETQGISNVLAEPPTLLREELQAETPKQKDESIKEKEVLNSALSDALKRQASERKTESKKLLLDIENLKGKINGLEEALSTSIEDRRNLQDANALLVKQGSGRESVLKSAINALQEELDSFKTLAEEALNTSMQNCRGLQDANALLVKQGIERESVLESAINALQEEFNNSKTSAEEALSASIKECKELRDANVLLAKQLTEQENTHNAFAEEVKSIMTSFEEKWRDTIGKRRNDEGT